MRMGAEALADAELLAILLRVGTQQATALDLARFIIQNYGGFRGLDSRSFTELCQVDGIGHAKAAIIDLRRGISPIGSTRLPPESL